MATGDPTPRADWFWLRDSGLLWVWSSAAEAPARRRFTVRWDGAAPVPLAESPRRPGPGPMLDLIGVGAAADLRAWAAAGPEGEVRFVAGPSVRPVVHRTGGLVLRWVRGPWANVGVAALTARGPRDYLFRWEQTVPAAGGEFPLPTEWLSREATELLVTPVDGDGRRGPTSRVVIPPQPPQLSVCFQQEMVGDGDRRGRRLRVEAAAVGAGAPADLEVHWAQGPREPRVFALRVERPNVVYTLRLPEAGYNDRVTVRAGGAADGVEYRYAAGTPGATAPGDAPVRRAELASGIDLREFTHVHRHSLPDPTAGAPPVPVSETGALRVLADDLLATPLGGSLPAAARSGVAALPAAPLVHLARLGGNPELWRAVGLLLGAGADPVSDYLTRPHEYDLLFNDPLVREVVRVCPIPAAGLRSVRDLVLATPARERADRSIFGQIGAILGIGAGRPDPHREYLERADDAVVNIWLVGVAAGDADRCTPAELYQLTAVRRWRCSALDLTLAVRYLRTFETEPIRVLRTQLIPSPSDPVCGAVDGAAEAENEALNTSASLIQVFEAHARRKAALARARERLEQVVAPPGATDDLARVADLLTKGELRRAVFILEKLCGATELPPAAPDMTFRVEARWADHRRRAADEQDQRARQAAAWCRRLFADRMLPTWPVPPAADPNPTPDWERLLEHLLAVDPNGAAWSRHIPANLAVEFRALLDEVRKATPAGRAADVLGEMVRHAAHLIWWLAAPTVARRAAADVREKADRLTTDATRDRVAHAKHLASEAEAGSPNWEALTAALKELTRLAEEEQVWVDAAAVARKAGLLPTAAGYTTDAVARWLRQPGNDAPADDADLAARETGLLKSLADAGVSAPADPARPGLPAPGPTLLYPDEYAALGRLMKADHGDRAGRVARLEAALRQWWRVHPDWLDVRVGRGEWGRIAAAARVLADLPDIQAEVQGLLLSGYNHDPSLAALVRPRAAAGWVGGAEDSGLVTQLQSVVGRAADTRALLDDPSLMSDLRADTAALRARAGPRMESLIGLRVYLADRLQHLLGQARDRCPELPDPAAPGGLAAALALIAGCETGDVSPTDSRAAALRAAGVLRGEGLA